MRQFSKFAHEVLWSQSLKSGPLSPSELRQASSILAAKLCHFLVKELREDEKSQQRWRKSHMLSSAGQSPADRILPESTLAVRVRSSENVTPFSPVIPFLGIYTKEIITHASGVCVGGYLSKCYL